MYLTVTCLVTCMVCVRWAVCMHGVCKLCGCAEQCMLTGAANSHQYCGSMRVRASDMFGSCWQCAWGLQKAAWGLSC
jgi:hypothetical protein